MSVFGGDSWAREAQQRKRRVEDLVVEGLDGSSYKTLSSGKYACLVCPHNPILDSPLMLSIHSKGSRHRAAESRLKERELMRQNEISKRIALSDSSSGTAKCSTSTHNQKFKSVDKPLIEQTRKTTSDVILNNQSPQQNSGNGSHDIQLILDRVTNRNFNQSENKSYPAFEAADKVVTQRHLDFKERQERELKFRAAGWKRDCHGKWFRDENVEFDSDEEDPNVCLG